VEADNVPPGNQPDDDDVTSVDTELDYYEHPGDGRAWSPARPPPPEDPTEDDLVAAAEEIDVMHAYS
jgi:hypothetical protein